MKTGRLQTGRIAISFYFRVKKKPHKISSGAEKRARGEWTLLVFRMVPHPSHSRPRCLKDHILYGDFPFNRSTLVFSFSWRPIMSLHIKNVDFLFGYPDNMPCHTQEFQRRRLWCRDQSAQKTKSSSDKGERRVGPSPGPSCSTSASEGPSSTAGGSGGDRSCLSWLVTFSFSFC